MIYTKGEINNNFSTMMNIYASFVEIAISGRVYIHLNSGPSITDV